jgi:hypothetical protein
VARGSAWRTVEAGSAPRRVLAVAAALPAGGRPAFCMPKFSGAERACAGPRPCSVQRRTGSVRRPVPSAPAGGTAARASRPLLAPSGRSPRPAVTFRAPRLRPAAGSARRAALRAVRGPAPAQRRAAGWRTDGDPGFTLHAAGGGEGLHHAGRARRRQRPGAGRACTGAVARPSRACWRGSRSAGRLLAPEVAATQTGLVAIRSSRSPRILTAWAGQSRPAYSPCKLAAVRDGWCHDRAGAGGRARPRARAPGPAPGAGEAAARWNPPRRPVAVQPCRWAGAGPRTARRAARRTEPAAGRSRGARNVTAGRARAPGTGASRGRLARAAVPPAGADGTGRRTLPARRWTEHGRGPAQALRGADGRRHAERGSGGQRGPGGQRSSKRPFAGRDHPRGPGWTATPFRGPPGSVPSAACCETASTGSWSSSRR